MLIGAPVMDSVYRLDAVARGHFLRGVARALRCAYICLWSYLPNPSNCLVSMDGWFHEKGSSSSSGSVLQRLFDVYRGTFCSINNNTVPGIVYKQGPEGWPYLELGETGVRQLASLPAQRQFYQEAGIKTTVFIGCNSGVIEFGFPYLSDTNLQNDIRSLFSEEIIQQAQLGELIFPADHNHPSSSSSSLRSLSVGSPADSSPFLVNKEINPSYEPSQIIPTQFYSPQNDDAVMARAILTVLSATSSISTSASIFQQPQEQSKPQICGMTSKVGAFKRYNPSLAPRVEPRQSSRSQQMAKMTISILRRINLMKMEARFQESRPTATQLHHVISERKRREKLNESFLALKSLLPQGPKKDKASILANTREYLNTLKSQVSQLEEKNKLLEAQLKLSSDEHETKEGTESSEILSLQIIRASESTSTVQRITVRIIARVECDMTELTLRVLEFLREMEGISLESVDARTKSQETGTSTRLILTLQIKAGDWDEETFKEALRRKIEGVVASPENES